MEQPHDHLFRVTFSERAQAAALLQGLLPPAVGSAIDWRTLRATADSFVDDRLRGCHADLLFTASLAGEPLLIYLLLEHKSTPDPLTAFQLLRYAVRVLESWHRDHPGADSLPFVLPVVVHHGPAAWRGPREMLELFALDRVDPAFAAAIRPLLPQLRPLLVDLPSTSIDDLLRLPPAAALVLLCLQFVRGRDTAAAVASLRRATGLIASLLSTPGGRDRLDRIWSYVLVACEIDPGPVGAMLAEAVGNPAKESFMSTAEKLLQRGRAEGRAETLVQLLRKRFPDLDAASIDRVRQAGPEQISRWLDRLFEARSAAALLADD